MTGDSTHRRYSWYKHHAWAALAMLSIFFAFTRLVRGVPQYVSTAVVAALCIYALVAIVFTYRHNREHACEQNGTTESSRAAELKKDNEKMIKKRIKADQKISKKSK